MASAISYLFLNPVKPTGCLHSRCQGTSLQTHITTLNINTMLLVRRTILLLLRFLVISILPSHRWLGCRFQEWHSWVMTSPQIRTGRFTVTPLATIRKRGSPAKEMSCSAPSCLKIASLVSLQGRACQRRRLTSKATTYERASLATDLELACAVGSRQQSSCKGPFDEEPTESFQLYL